MGSGVQVAVGIGVGVAIGAGVGVAVGIGVAVGKDVGSGIQVAEGGGTVSKVGWISLQAVNTNQQVRTAMADIRLNNWNPLASMIWLLAIVAGVMCKPHKGARGQTLTKAHTSKVEEVTDPRDYGVSTISSLSRVVK